MDPREKYELITNLKLDVWSSVVFIVKFLHILQNDFLLAEQRKLVNISLFKFIKLLKTNGFP